MTEKTFQVYVVSAEEEIFAGEAVMLMATGKEGEFGVIANHSPLLTQLVPGEILIRRADNKEESIYSQGGFLEVQPNVVTILSDTAVRAENLDQAKVLEAKERALQLLQGHTTEVEYAHILEELARTAAQLRILNKLRQY